MTTDRVRELAIAGPMIRLGQLLKLGGLVGSGGEVRSTLQAGQVRVNGSPEPRRGRQLHPGDVVQLGTVSLRVVAAGAAERDVT